MPRFQRDLENQKPLLIAVDRVAKRYGVRPHVILMGDPAAWQVDLAVFNAGVMDENRQARKRK